MTKKNSNKINEYEILQTTTNLKKKKILKKKIQKSEKKTTKCLPKKCC